MTTRADNAPAPSPDLLVYLSGRTLPRAQATLSIDDRGTLFGDGVYEVLNYHAGRPHAMQRHLDRLRRSLAGIHLPEPEAVGRLPDITDDLVRRNGLADARVYWQITRGPAPRSHLPPDNPTPTVLVVADPALPIDPVEPPRAWQAITREDLRWSCCWIKSLMLLPNTLAKQEAHQAGCQEAIFHRSGVITEGGSTNVFIVADDALYTHPADQWILPGVTRAIVLDLARSLGLNIREQAFTLDQLRRADEVFLTGTTTRVAAITHVDDQPIAAGAVGPITQQLHARYLQSLLEGVRSSR